MTRYEYRTIDLASKVPGLKKEDPEEKLNRLGRDGFELVERVEQQFGGTQLLVLVREVPE